MSTAPTSSTPASPRHSTGCCWRARRYSPMQDPLSSALRIGASGLEVQSQRMRVVTENLANAQSTGKTPGADPYTRKFVTFENELDETIGANVVKVASIERHNSPYRLE